ncbi:MAG TPA: precorrin-4 C(11)-methyltransferase [Candidatus Brocadiia bacterium]|nr:precorrin-4 C(11)-methyltransferase [Planctomycetota bacterium]MDO8092089.1 precorrin-4 C(11)-methyltransferase [Candidatus Brocadiales bacterium]
MKVYFIGAGPGDPELMTIKGKKAIEQAGYCIYAGSLVSKEILHYARPDAKLYDSSRMPLEEQLSIIAQAKSVNEDVARIHSGDPTIYGAIQEQMRTLDEMGITYEVIPGVSSFTASAAALKQELTLPGVSQTIILTRLEGNTPVPEDESLDKLAASKATMCIFLSADRIMDVASKLIPSYGADCPAAIVYKASSKDERIIRSSLSQISEKVAQSGIKKTALIIVGQVLEKNFDRSKLYSKEFINENKS